MPNNWPSKFAMTSRNCSSWLRDPKHSARFRCAGVRSEHTTSDMKQPIYGSWPPIIPAFLPPCIFDLPHSPCSFPGDSLPSQPNSTSPASFPYAHPAKAAPCVSVGGEPASLTSRLATAVILRLVPGAEHGILPSYFLWAIRFIVVISSELTTSFSASEKANDPYDQAQGQAQ